MSLPESNTYAAVDLGSNSFHMIVAKDNGEDILLIDRIKDMIRLAGGLDDNNILSDEAIERALQALERFGQRINEIPSGNVRAVGTNTLRKARNGNVFLAKARQALGHPIEIISGIEEARLINLGVAHTVYNEKDKRLVIDIGGGSTEIIIGKGFDTLLAESLYMGSVSVSKHYFEHSEITAKKIRKAKIFCRQELEAIETIYKQKGWDSAIGSSGTILTINNVLQEKGWSENGITKTALEQLIDTMVSAGHIDKLKFGSLPDNRKPVFPGGVTVLAAVFEALDIELMTVSDGALREGLLHDLIGRVHDKDARDNTINSFMSRYSVDMDHTQRIINTARYCFEQVQSDWELDKKQDLKMIEWAIGLHEIGLTIAHSHYQKHGAYLLNHSDMPGFSRQTQAELAILVGSHRRKFVPTEIQLIPEENFVRMLHLCIIVRLAILLHRSRSSDTLPDFKLKAHDSMIELTFAENWLNDHPLTGVDLETEAGYLSTVGIKLVVH
jgi:exopolyphosphatase/guanosine-5'-triphosphate,3'-diphosphate pyrophosphatase